MIDISDDDKYVIALRRFYAVHGRPPSVREMDRLRAIPTASTLNRHFGCGIEQLWVELFNLEPTDNVIESYAQTKSKNGERDVFYLTSKEIADMHGVPIKRVGAHLREYTKPGARLLGYQLSRFSHGNGARMTYKATRTVKLSDIIK